MKKISLKNINLKEIDQLSREQLKNVLGGWNQQETAGTADSDCDCNTSDVCTGKDVCRNCGSNGTNGQKWGKCQL